jgi:hypothetical protein
MEAAASGGFLGIRSAALGRARGRCPALPPCPPALTYRPLHQVVLAPGGAALRATQHARSFLQSGHTVAGVKCRVRELLVLGRAWPRRVPRAQDGMQTPGQAQEGQLRYRLLPFTGGWGPPRRPLQEATRCPRTAVLTCLIFLMGWEPVSPSPAMSSPSILREA